MTLALKMEEVVMSHGMEVATRRGQGTNSPLEPPGEIQPWQHLEFRPVHHSSDI